MKRFFSFPLFFVSTIITAFLHLVILPALAEETAKDNALQTALALNYCHASLCKIISYNDRIVLEEEYSNIINNINLTKIQDEEVINLLKGLMDTISFFKLAEGDKERFFKEYERQVANALYSSFSGVTNIIYTGGANPYTMAATLLVQIGGAYGNYRNNMETYRKNLDEKLWKLEKDTIIQLNDNRKDFLTSYWRLMKEYSMPDKWRLTEKQMENYVNVLKDKDLDRKVRQLERIEQDFEAYPPFWYYFGQAAQEIKKYDLASQAYQEFERIRKGFFREDHFYSSVLMNKIALLDTQKDRDLILQYLEKMTNESPSDWRKNLFAAIKYSELQKYDEATELLSINIDNQKNVSLNTRILGDLYLMKNDRKGAQSLLDRMINEDNIKNQDILYLVGKMPELKKLNKMRDQIINIDVDIDESIFGNDDLIFSVPDKWVLDDVATFKVTMNFEGKKLHPTQFDTNKANRLVNFRFEKAIDAGDFITNKRSADISFDLSHPSNPIKLVGELEVTTGEKEKGYVDKGIDTVKGLSTKIWKSEKAEKPEDKKTGGIIVFKKREIITNGNRYRISEDNNIVKFE